MSVWKFKFTFTFADNSPPAVIDDFAVMPQMFAVWETGDIFAQGRGTTVVKVERTNITPGGMPYPSNPNYDVFTIRPPCLLNLNKNSQPVCPNCGEVTNEFYAHCPILNCWKCGKSMYPVQTKVDKHK